MMASLYTPAQLIPRPTPLLAPVRVGHQQGEPFGIRKVLSLGFVDAHSVWEEVRPQWLRVARAGERAGRKRGRERASSMEC
jgi:hypothetical protein